jgi:hypothetical protein
MHFAFQQIAVADGELCLLKPGYRLIMGSNGVQAENKVVNYWWRCI